MEKFCGVNKYQCDNDCNGRGICLKNKTCFCDYLFGDKNCSKFNPCDSKDISICKELYIIEGLAKKERILNFVFLIIFFLIN